jgi:hypothetical protein
MDDEVVAGDEHRSSSSEVLDGTDQEVPIDDLRIVKIEVSDWALVVANSKLEAIYADDEQVQLLVDLHFVVDGVAERRLAGC